MKPISEIKNWIIWGIVNFFLSKSSLNFFISAVISEEIFSILFSILYKNLKHNNKNILNFYNIKKIKV